VPYRRARTWNIRRYADQDHRNRVRCSSASCDPGTSEWPQHRNRGWFKTRISFGHVMLLLIAGCMLRAADSNRSQNGLLVNVP
jgi:hypothetical protein